MRDNPFAIPAIGCETDKIRVPRAMSDSRAYIEASQTLDAAFLEGLRPWPTCLREKRMGPVKAEPCRYKAQLHLETLIWAKGARYIGAFPSAA